MVKKYISTTVFSYNVYPETGGYIHIKFSPNMQGGGTYITDREDIQYGIEHSKEYGMSVNIDTTFVDCSVSAENVEGGAVDQKKENESVEVSVSDIGEAKEYLVENFGYNSSSLRSKKAILEAAENSNVVFKGI